MLELKAANRNPLAHFYVVARADHFSTLAPLSVLIARKINADVAVRSKEVRVLRSAPAVGRASR